MADPIVPAVTITKQIDPKKIKPDAKTRIEEMREVVGKKVNTQRVQYNGENLHVLSDGVYSLSKGENHVCRELLAKEKTYPSFISMIESGIVVLLDESSDFLKEKLSEEKA